MSDKGIMERIPVELLGDNGTVNIVGVPIYDLKTVPPSHCARYARIAASDLFGNGMTLWVDNNRNPVIAIGAHQDDTVSANSGAIHLFSIARTSSSGGGCSSDCTAPTIGLNVR